MLITMRAVQIALFSVLTGIISQAQNLELARAYFEHGEFDKARELYDELATNKNLVPDILSEYLELLKVQKDLKQAEKFLAQVTKWYGPQIQYQLEEYQVYQHFGDNNKAQALLRKIKTENQANQYQLSFIAQILTNKRLYAEAADFLQEARKTSGLKTAYALDLARIYGSLGQKERMVEEYLLYARESSRHVQYIQNIFQNLLRDEDDLGFLERTIISKMQSEPNERVYPEMMLWVEKQRKNFYGAFIQARALDRRDQKMGDETSKVGEIALANKAWDDAIMIYEYLVVTYNDASVNGGFRRKLIEAKENKVKNTFPVDVVEIRNLSREYTRLYRELGPNVHTLEALRNQALLHAFYLGEVDTAVLVLNTIISTPRAGSNLIAQSKLDLGDIYILKNQPWEATLLYSQVEKAQKETPVGYLAKLKNAKVNFYTGNFALAKSHLDILKRATTREISNDAIDLSLLISDNTYLDSTDAVMMKYAGIELLIFQNRKAEAKRALNQMLVDYPRHSLTDDIYWRLSELHLEAGEYQKSIDYLEKILVEYNYDVLADDAAFKIAEITEWYLKDLPKAQELYRKFMMDYPGSLYTAEARKRFRKLRGDFGS
jgi:pentatricopeptide repeat protein